MTLLYHKTQNSTRQSPAILGATVTLYVFKHGSCIAGWQRSRDHGRIVDGSISVKGYGFKLAFPGRTDAENFKKAHHRALKDCELTTVTTDELLTCRDYTIVLCEYPTITEDAFGVRKCLRMMSEIRTIHTAAFLALTPQQKHGREGDAIRSGRLPR